MQKTRRVNLHPYLLILYQYANEFITIRWLFLNATQFIYSAKLCLKLRPLSINNKHEFDYAGKYVVDTAYNYGSWFFTYSILYARNWRISSNSCFSYDAVRIGYEINEANRHFSIIIVNLPRCCSRGLNRLYAFCKRQQGNGFLSFTR